MITRVLPNRRLQLQVPGHRYDSTAASYASLEVAGKVKSHLSELVNFRHRMEAGRTEGCSHKRSLVDVLASAKLVETFVVVAQFGVYKLRSMKGSCGRDLWFYCFLRFGYEFGFMFSLLPTDRR